MSDIDDLTFWRERRRDEYPDGWSFAFARELVRLLMAGKPAVVSCSSFAVKVEDRAVTRIAAYATQGSYGEAFVRGLMREPGPKGAELPWPQPVLDSWDPRVLLFFCAPSWRIESGGFKASGVSSAWEDGGSRVDDRSLLLCVEFDAEEAEAEELTQHVRRILAATRREAGQAFYCNELFVPRPPPTALLGEAPVPNMPRHPAQCSSWALPEAVLRVDGVPIAFRPSQPGVLIDICGGRRTLPRLMTASALLDAILAVAPKPDGPQPDAPDVVRAEQEGERAMTTIPQEPWPEKAVDAPPEPGAAETAAEAEVASGERAPSERRRGRRRSAAAGEVPERRERERIPSAADSDAPGIAAFAMRVEPEAVRAKEALRTAARRWHPSFWRGEGQPLAGRGRASHELLAAWSVAVRAMLEACGAPADGCRCGFWIAEGDERLPWAAVRDGAFLLRPVRDDGSAVWNLREESPEDGFGYGVLLKTAAEVVAARFGDRSAEAVLAAVDHAAIARAMDEALAAVAAFYGRPWHRWPSLDARLKTDAAREGRRRRARTSATSEAEPASPEPAASAFEDEIDALAAALAKAPEFSLQGFEDDLEGSVVPSPAEAADFGDGAELRP